jgi:uncharacterized metal-binding protein
MAYKDWSCKDTTLEAAIKQTVSGIDVMDWGELADMVIMLKDALAECNATCEGLDSYAAVCVANVQRLEAENRILVEILRRTYSLLCELGSPYCNTKLALKDIAMMSYEIRAALAQGK